MSRIDELERDLAKQREKVAARTKRRNELRAAMRRKGASIDDRIDRAEELREDRDRNQEQLVIIRDRLEAIELDGITEEERERHAHLIERLETEVDANEDLTATLEDVLTKIALARDQKGNLEKVRSRVGNKLDNAIAKRENLEKALKRARKRRKENQATDELDSPYFVVEEFDCRNGTPVPTAAYPALKANVKGYLEPLRKSGGEVRINSGFRTAAYNAAVGGASNSIHVYSAHPNATAVDHVQSTRSPGEVQRWHDANTHPDGMGYYSSFTHVDNRNRIGWGDSRWNGP